MQCNNGTTHAYGSLSQTVDGAIGTNALTASATLATAALVIGSIIKVSVAEDEYTVATVSGTSITTVEPLGDDYIGALLQVDVISAWAGFEGFGSLATQATAANRPAFVPNLVNGYDVIEFNGGAKALPLANYSQSDNIFATGGTFTFIIGADTAGGGTAGRVIDKGNNVATSAWNVLVSTFSGGFYRLTFNQTTTGTAGSWRTNSVVTITEPQVVTITYNASTPTVPPVFKVQGIVVTTVVTTAPTGTAISDAGGVYTVGNRPAGDRAFDGRIFDLRLYKRVLTTYEINAEEALLANKWALTLLQSGTRRYGGREYIITTPAAPATVPLLVCLPGGGATALDFVLQLQLGALFGEVAVLTFLTGTLNNGNPPAQTFNSGGLQTYNHAPDSEYIKNFIAFIKAELALLGYTIDEVIIIGHSNGGMMGYRMLIDHPEIIDGLFAMSADVMIFNPDEYTGRIKHLHGADDDNVPLAGGVGSGGVYFTPVIATVQEFTHVNDGNGVTDGASLSDDLTVLPSPATHEVLSLKTALALAPYSTTLPQVIFDFVFP